MTLNRIVAIAAAVWVAVFLSAKQLYAQTSCLPTKEVMKKIKEGDEKLAFRGLSVRGYLVTIYIAPSGKFTALVHMTDLRSCLVDHGQNGEIMELQNGRG
jgi:hypothetical protein